MLYVLHLLQRLLQHLVPPTCAATAAAASATAAATATAVAGAASDAHLLELPHLPVPVYVVRGVLLVQRHPHQRQVDAHREAGQHRDSAHLRHQSAQQLQSTRAAASCMSIARAAAGATGALQWHQGGGLCSRCVPWTTVAHTGPSLLLCPLLEGLPPPGRRAASCPLLLSSRWPRIQKRGGDLCGLLSSRSLLQSCVLSGRRRCCCPCWGQLRCRVRACCRCLRRERHPAGCRRRFRARAPSPLGRGCRRQPCPASSSPMRRPAKS